MDNQQFDNLTRKLASGVSRRTLFRGIAGGALGLIHISRASAQNAGKVGICHATGSASNPYQYIEVSQNAYNAHVAHGDLVSCETGFKLNLDTCTCDLIPNFCGAAEDRCGPAQEGRCVTDVASGSLVCAVNTPPQGCQVCADSSTCPSGQICASDVNDAGCGGTHCHPLL